jgi:hypothetical protein
MVAKPATQVGLTAAGNVAADETGDASVGGTRLAPYVGMAVPFALGGTIHAGQRTFSAAPAATAQEAERRALLQYGRSIGAPQTAGKIIDSGKLQTVESAMDKFPLPGLGQRASATEAANRNAYQRKALESAGIYGETAATPNVLETGQDKLSQRFEELTTTL